VLLVTVMVLICIGGPDRLRALLIAVQFGYGTVNCFESRGFPEMGEL
jgi:hypothetical protein